MRILRWRWVPALLSIPALCIAAVWLVVFDAGNRYANLFQTKPPSAEPEIVSISAPPGSVVTWGEDTVAVIHSVMRFRKTRTKRPTFDNYLATYSSADDTRRVPADTSIVAVADRLPDGSRPVHLVLMNRQSIGSVPQVGTLTILKPAKLLAVYQFRRVQRASMR